MQFKVWTRTPDYGPSDITVKLLGGLKLDYIIAIYPISAPLPAVPYVNEFAGMWTDLMDVKLLVEHIGELYHTKVHNSIQ